MDANGAAPVDSNNGGGSYAGTFNQTLSSKEMQDQFTYVRLTPTNVVQNGKAFPSLPHLQFLDGVGKNIDLQQRPCKFQLAGRGRGPPTRAPAPPATSSSGLGLLVVPPPLSSAAGHLPLQRPPPWLPPFADPLPRARARPAWCHGGRASSLSPSVASSHA